MMNKKADIPTTMLFIVAIVLAIAALFSFATFKNNFDSQSKEFSNTMTDIHFKQKYIIESIKFSAKKSIMEKQEFRVIILEKPFIYPGTENFFTKIDKNQFTFKNENNLWTFKMKELSLNSKQGATQIYRTLNLCMQFNEQGDFTGNCDNKESIF